MIVLDREDVSSYHRYGVSYTVADCSWQGPEQGSWAGLGSYQDRCVGLSRVVFDTLQCAQI
jgi:hypothetical protein